MGPCLRRHRNRRLGRKRRCDNGDVVADQCLAKAHAQYDEKVHASLASAYGQDFGVWTLTYLEHAYLVLGYPDKGSRAIHEALALARRLNHPLSLCNALMFNAMSSGHRHDEALASKFNEEARQLETKHGFPQYVAITTGGREGIIVEGGS
jgi:hypothetical protein